MKSWIWMLVGVMVFCVACSGDDAGNSGGDTDAQEGDSDVEAPEIEEIDPFAFDPPDYDYPTCESITAEKTLAEKAVYFDKVAREQHITGDGLMRNIYLTEDLQAVDHYEHAENVILWSGIYIASQALRYRVTGDAEALENTRIVVEALGYLTAVTGSRGLYARSMDDPEVSYNSVSTEHPGWTDSPVKGYEGWRYRNDVSKDGYDGLMMGYALALEHFDDEELRETIRGRLRDIMDHIISNGLQLIDAHTGEVTEHGRLYYSAVDDWPGFNALLISSWIKVAVRALGDEELDDFYYGCLMRMREGVECPDIEFADLGSYIDAMETMLILFQPDCKENYDSFDMAYQAMYPLLRLEEDETLHERLLGSLRTNMFHTDDPKYRSLVPLGNAFFAFAYAALTGDDPAEDALLREAVDNAVCTMKRFPDEKYQHYIPKGEQEAVCISRLDRGRSDVPIPLEEYYFDNYLWRLDFYEIEPAERPEDRRQVFSPEDYLLAYWMGRYHGILSEDQ